MLTPAARTVGRVKLSGAEVLITRDADSARITLNMRRRENVNWQYITLSAEDVKALITELLGTL